MTLLGPLLFLAGTVGFVDTPLPITNVSGFELNHWSVMCFNVESARSACLATRDVNGRCLRLSFSPEEAYAELRRECRNDRGPREAIALPLRSRRDVTDAIGRLLRADNADTAAIQTEEFDRDARLVATYLFRITNG